MLNKDRLPKELNNKELKKALNVLEVINLSDEEREEYENRLNWLRIEASAVKRAEERGKAEGKVEGKAKLIQMMIKQGKTIEQIIEFTGLPKEEIEELKLE
ncbi:hypothetical protein A1I_07875 [Rickettsia bellii OSU 85-389]|nr:hypothetical protein A1I_07875 [Rickettsia bellii OSU 85-389]